jgi:hypothetical protein
MHGGKDEGWKDRSVENEKIDERRQMNVAGAIIFVICKIFGQARRPAPTKACRGDPLWSPVFRKSDFDVALF